MDTATFTEDIRRLLAFYEAHQDFPAPIYEGMVTICLDIRFESKEKIAGYVRALQSLGGIVRKSPEGEDFYITKTIGGFGFLMYSRREDVCNKRVVGKKFVPEKIIEASEAKVIPAHEEEIVEWYCGPLLSEPGSVAETTKGA